MRRVGDNAPQCFSLRISRRSRTAPKLYADCFKDPATVPVFEPLVIPNPNARTIYLCGDSTVTDQRNEPWGSWGQILPAFVKQGWSVSNFARSG